MPTYPNTSINKITMRSRGAANTPYIPGVFLTGFTPRGPIDKVYRLTALSQFEMFFGVPETDIEYAAFTAIRNAFRGGAVVDFQRIPYKNITPITEMLNNSVSYYLTAEEKDLEEIVEEITSEDYLNKALKHQLNSVKLTEHKAFYWSQTPDSNVTHHLEFNQNLTIDRLL